MWGNVGKMLYKNGLQVSVGHLRVPGAGIEPARIAPLVFETSASTDSAIRAGVLCPKTGTRRIDLLVKDCKGIGNFGNCKINDIPWTENPIELTKVELKTFYNSEYHGTLDGNIRESVQGVFAQVCSLRYVRPRCVRSCVFAQVCSDAEHSSAVLPSPGRSIVQNAG